MTSVLETPFSGKYIKYDCLYNMKYKVFHRTKVTVFHLFVDTTLLSQLDFDQINSK